MLSGFITKFDTLDFMIYGSKTICNQFKGHFICAAMEKMSLDRLNGIIAFTRAAALGSYTAASRSLSISPSAVSKSIQRLEQRLGIILFNRTTRSITLTKEGQELYDKAILIVNDIELLEQVAIETRSGRVGTIIVTAPYPISVHVIAPYLPDFKKKYPEIIVDLRVSDTFIDLIKNKIDVAIRVGNLPDSRLIARKMAPNWIGFYASPDYILEEGMPAFPEDLKKHILVSTRYQSSAQLVRWPLYENDKQVGFFTNTKFIADNTDAVAQILINGGGIGMLPVYVGDPLIERGLLTPVLKKHYVARSEINAIWPESRKNNPNVRVFVDFYSEIFIRNKFTGE